MHLILIERNVALYARYTLVRGAMVWWLQSSQVAEQDSGSIPAPHKRFYHLEYKVVRET